MQRNGGVDALRGLAIFVVIVNHIAIRIPLQETYVGRFIPRPVVDAVTQRGYEGVFVFFVISGFLITQMSLRRWGACSNISLRGFYIRRFARIAPLLITLVAVLAILSELEVPNFVIDGADQSLIGAIASALGFYLNWYEAHTTWLPGNWDVLWSLSIEEIFYIVFPLIAVTAKRSAVLAPLLLLFSLSLPFIRESISGNEIWVEKAYLPGMAAISTGIFMALIAECVALPGLAISAVTAVFSLLVLVSAFVFENTIWAFIGNGFMLLLTFPSALLLLGCHWVREHGADYYPGPRWLRIMGRYSYEIYLSHMFVVFALVSVFEYFFKGHSAGFICYLIAVPLCTALGAIVSRSFSTPADLKIRQALLRNA